MQERSERHDLEMDKSALERQVCSDRPRDEYHFLYPSFFLIAIIIMLLFSSQAKELKSRLADMEGQTRPTAGITLLESKIQELEERLRSEERYNLDDS